jgi:hypothetical protein
MKEIKGGGTLALVLKTNGTETKKEEEEKKKKTQTNWKNELRKIMNK